MKKEPHDATPQVGALTQKIFPILGIILLPQLVLLSLWKSIHSSHITIGILFLLCCLSALFSTGFLLFQHANKIHELQQQLVQVEKKNAFFLENATVSIFQMTESGDILNANPKLAHLLGYENQVEMIEQINQNPLRLFATAEQQYGFFTLIETQRNVKDLETQFADSQDKAIAVLINASLVLNDTDGVATIDCMVEDLSKFKQSDEQIVKLNRGMAQRLDNIVLLNYELERAYESTIEGWSRALDLRDHETEGHSQRVTELTVHLCERLQMSYQQIQWARIGALLHDIGKMGIPDNILLKQGPLTDDEWQVMRWHPQYAYELLAPIDFLKPALDIPYCHHEKWNGTGYPRRLVGKDIPLSARVFSIVDVWDALRSDRPYRSAWPHARVSEYMRDQSGIHFDPTIIPVFLEMIENDSKTRGQRSLQTQQR